MCSFISIKPGLYIVVTIAQGSFKAVNISIASSSREIGLPVIIRVCSINFVPPDNDLCSACHDHPTRFFV